MVGDLLLLPGWGMRATVWDGLAGRLRRQRPGLRLHAPDLPGYGAAPATDGLQGQLDRLLQAAPPQALWVGWSLGGLLALAAAAQAPQRVAGLVMLAATPRFVRAPDWPQAMPEATLLGFADGLRNDHAGTLRRFFGLVARGAPDERALLRALRGQLLAAPPPPLPTLDQGLALLRDLDLRPALAASRCPLLLLLGGRDRLVPPGVGEAVRALRPDARVVIIPDAGHAPFLSHPDSCAEVLLGLLHD